jgi:RNA polymerase subunit RPABC4/transcription elongation factor Spt4
MSETFPDSPTFRVFSCPQCSYTMNTTQSRCPSCSTTIDAATAQSAAETLSIVDQAISDASYINIVLYTILGVFPAVLAWMAKFHLTLPLLLLSPSLPGLAGTLYVLGLLAAITMCGVTVMAVRWWLLFAKLPSTDSDYIAARRKVLSAAAIATLIVVVMTAITLVLISRA